MIHEMPKEWRENADALARDVADAINERGVVVSARVMYRGGWKVGYSTAGNYKVTVSWERGWKHRNQESVSYRGKPDLAKILKWWKKHERKHYLAMTWNMVLGWYRSSGLIPSRTAKRHAKLMRDADEKETTALRMGATYIIKRGLCPHCGKRGFDEQLMGFECRHCQSWWDDVQYKWHKAKGETCCR